LARGANVITATATDELSSGATATTTIVQDDIKITSIAVNNEILDVSTPNVATIFFTLDTQATVTLKIFPETQGPTGTPVYQASQNCPGAGSYAFSWDGKNSAGQNLSDEAYLYILEAADGIVTTIYSPAAPTGTANITCARSEAFDPFKNEPMIISYSVPVAARVTVSVTKPTPWRYDLLRATPSTAGSFSMTWNGRDRNGNLLLRSGGSVYCTAAPLRENNIITVGNAPIVSNITIDPFKVSLSYGAFAKVRYNLNRDANVQISLIPPSGSALILHNSQLESAGDHEVEWNGLDLTDATGKKAVISAEGSYVLKIQATNPVTGASASASENLLISH
jgi:flagellar hook assembly protein FlgD